MDECKPLPRCFCVGTNTSGQGLTLVHYSAQPMPFWSVRRFVSSLWRVMTHLSTEGTQRNPQKVLTLSSEVTSIRPCHRLKGILRGEVVCVVGLPGIVDARLGDAVELDAGSVKPAAAATRV